MKWDIFNYGGGKPAVRYMNSASHPHTYQIQYSNGEVPVYYDLKDVPYQRWNLFVINYYDSSVDLFVNGELRNTTPLNAGQFLKTSDTENIVIGQNSDNGLNGAICSVYFYAAPMKPKDIIQMYNALREKNPPV